MHKILININRQGQATVEAQGYNGPSCADVTKPFIDALGERIQETPTFEMFLPPQESTEGIHEGN